MKKIIYLSSQNKICILTPTEEALQFATIEQIAEKDVSHGLPYWIVDEKDLPEDMSFFGAWELDEEKAGEPHGYGGESDQFPKEIIDKYVEYLKEKGIFIPNPNEN